MAARATRSAAVLADAARALQSAQSHAWAGQAADAFRAHVRQDILPLARAAADAVGRGAAALRRWSASLAGFQQEARQLDRQAQACRAGMDAALRSSGTPARAHGRNGSSGTATAPATPGASAAARAEGAALDAVLARAEDLHARYLAAARTAAAQLEDAGNLAPPPPARFLSLWRQARGAFGALTKVIEQAMIPGRGTGPAAVFAWWQSLDPATQHLLITDFPTSIGWLDGVPAPARDQANRIALTSAKARLQAQLAALQARQPPQTIPYAGRFGPVPNPAWQQWHDQVAAAAAKLAGIAALEKSLASVPTYGASHAYLLGFDTNGNGHAIVSLGNPDTATDTVTYVPGTGSRLAGAFGDIGRAGALFHQAVNDAPGTAIASIYWLNYDAPQLGLSQGAGNLAVAFTGDAVAGGRTLAQFQAGLAATHQPGVPSHAVVLGHSYGSLVAGEAAAHNGMRPGDLVFVGSGGVGVNQASQLGIGPAHVWAGANAHDPVPHLLPADPLSGSSSHFGTNPATPAFGGEVFNATSDPARSFGGFAGLDIAAHSSYWDPRSSSLFNMARIIVGQYGKVTLLAPPQPHPVPGPDATAGLAAGPVPTPAPGLAPTPAPGPGS
jgi:hypothetical protein